MNYEIIDFHTHPFITPTENFCFYPGSVETECDFLSDLRAAGISRFAGSIIDKKCKDIKGIIRANRLAMNLGEQYGGRYIPGIHIHPDYVAESIDTIKTAKERDVRLIGELVPYQHGYSYDNPGMNEILECVDGGDMLVSMHSVDADLPMMEKLAREHKDISFVFAHPGDLPRVKAHVEVMRRCENVYLDLSGTGLFRYGMLKHLVDSVGAERILFGTDYPICNPEMYVHAVLFEKISDRERELIFAGNAKRLLKL